MTDLNLPTKSEMGMNEFTETMTGHEELAVERLFGVDPYTLLETNPPRATRAMIYVHQLRHLKGLDIKSPETKAYAAAMDMPLRAAAEFWPDDVEEPDDEQPVTAAGEGDSADAS